eukprot:CAMPEP_0197865822 /NCGR_PEP_ID=MMETSP1438-20131217/43880_1 /TAXON_ID=1461541 /ORGANISM="Pterosperma sp., Strain CCMP1384" /LENGTH=386 /DNA_ID=CAMNT_0043484335 /DNA_START=154 /DNA_END=1314 /DNA_ORIENTATION=+
MYRERPWRLQVAALIALVWSPVVVQGNTVYLFRHCVRNVDYSEVQEYAKDKFPSWGVAKDMCLPRGLQIFQGIGTNMKDSFATPPMIIADNMQRNIDSAHALATGLGVPTTGVVVDHTPFDHSTCKAPDSKEKDKLISSRFKHDPPPANFTAMVKWLDGVLHGKKHVSDKKTKVDGDKLEGAGDIAGKAADVFLMQYGGGMQVGWGKVTVDEMYDLLQTHVYDWKVTHRSLALEVPKCSPMLAAILEALDPTATHDSTVFLGHDTDLNGVGTLLDIGWTAAPYPDNTTAPSAALRFQTSATKVTLDFVYTTFETTSGTMKTSPIFEMNLQDFCTRAVKNVDWSCVKPLTKGLCESTSREPTSYNIQEHRKQMKTVRATKTHHTSIV